ncbi:SHOCT domain-containing protein [Niveibacterium sp.]|uniref:SHOCT domain-containing protein n=1 Tax=Niveibacterium sp. TaxID=2017444 RepID=UPI0035B45A78
MNRSILSTRRLCLALATAAAFAGAPAAHAGPLDGLTDLFSDSESRITVWVANPTDRLNLSPWDYIELQQRSGAEKGAPNQHPVQLSADAVTRALSSVQVILGKDTVALFEQAEVSRLARAIAGSLTKAGPDQDLVFVSTSRHKELGAYGAKLTNTGRVFYADGALQLIVGVQLSDALLGLRPGTSPTRALDPGKRAKSSERVKIVDPGQSGARVVRNDWIAFQLDAAASAASAAPAAPAVVAPAAAPAAAAQPASSPAVDRAVQRHFSQQESRLVLLKRMRDQGLITEAEYEAKRAEALKNL